MRERRTRSFSPTSTVSPATGISRTRRRGSRATGTYFISKNLWPTPRRGAASRPKRLRGNLRTCGRSFFARREKRAHPYRDDKVLTDWNGVAIAAFSKAAAAFGEKRYSDAARGAIEFVRRNLVRDGRLLHRYREGEAGIAASVDDYAFFIWGLLEYYESVFDEEYLALAISLCRDQFEHFWDEEFAGFFFTADDGEALIARQKEIYDGALPSGNSVSTLNILKIARLTGDPDLEDRAARMAAAFSSQISRHPASFSMHMNSLDFMLGPSFEIVIAGDRNSPGTRRFLDALSGEFLPNKVVIVKDEANEAEISGIAPYARGHEPLDGKPAAYVCSNYECRLPTDDPARMLELIREAVSRKRGEARS